MDFKTSRVDYNMGHGTGGRQPASLEMEKSFKFAKSAMVKIHRQPLVEHGVKVPPLSILEKASFENL